jgi:hypothetical protein
MTDDKLSLAEGTFSHREVEEEDNSTAVEQEVK